MAVGLKHLPALQDQDRLHYKGRRRGYIMIALSLPQDSASPYGEFSPELLVPPVGKEPKETTSTVGNFAGNTTLISHHGDCRELSRGSNTGNLTDRESGKGLASTSTQILAG